MNRIGRWCNADNQYATMDTDYMESVIWAFQQLFQKDMIYQGYKVMPYSVGCHTVLSNSEAKQNYKMVVDYSITCKFRVSGNCLDIDETVDMLVWTTTPWTLNANMAICTRKDIKLVIVKDGDNQYIMSQVYHKKNAKKLPIIRQLVGKDIDNLPYFDLMGTERRVLLDDYVQETTGTGLVHCAPAFGEDDYRVCQRECIINDGMIDYVDENGCFTFCQIF